MEDEKHDEPENSVLNYLLLLGFVVAIFDLIQSIYFLIEALTLLVVNVSLYSVMAAMGSLFWIIIVSLLIIGLWKGIVHFIIIWLIFSMIGIIADIFFFIWTISISDRVHWNLITQFTLLYLGLVLEWFFIYIVYDTYFNKETVVEDEKVPKPPEQLPSDKEEAKIDVTVDERRSRTDSKQKYFVNKLPANLGPEQVTKNAKQWTNSKSESGEKPVDTNRAEMETRDSIPPDTKRHTGSADKLTKREYKRRMSRERK